MEQNQEPLPNQFADPSQQAVSMEQPAAFNTAAQPQAYSNADYNAMAAQGYNNQTAVNQAFAAPAQAAPMQAAPAQPEQPAPAKKENIKTTQGTLLISELRDSMVIMKDGSFRAVIACKSINFDLMSNNEREGVEYSYQSFLNSLNFPVQILIRSQRVDIGPYLNSLAEMRRNEDNMLLGRLMDDYINFIDVISQEANIMDKAFFIIIPYYSSKELAKQAEETKNIVGALSKSSAPSVTRINRETYDKAVTELNNYCESVVSGLYYMGVHGVRLNTRELSTLYYNFNNPDTAVHQPLGDFNKLAHMYVRKSKLGEEL